MLNLKGLLFFWPVNYTTFLLSTQVAEAGGTKAWGQPGLNGENLSQKKNWNLLMGETVAP
jgi:hypothetical protein